MGNLDPTAEEFRPTNSNHRAPPPTLSRQPPSHPQPYVFPYPVVQLQTATFFYPPVGVVPCPQFSPPSKAAAALSTSPTRSLLLNLAPSDTVVAESTLRKQLEAFGDVRGFQIEGLCATVHFYDLRHAEAAFTAIRWHRMQHHTTLRYHQYYALMPPPMAARGVVWAQYFVPACDDNDDDDGRNQGTIVVFNLDSKVDADTLREIFEPFGPVKELRHTASKKNQRFVEYFDIRDAARALKHRNGKEIHGKHVVIEFSRPGRGHFRNLKPHSYKLCPPFAPEDGENVTSPSPYYSQVKSSVTKGSCHHDNTAQVAMASVKTQQEPAAARSRNWKGKHAKKNEARFLIKEDATMESSSCLDSRTTVMIKNIPNKYSQKLLLSMLDTHCHYWNEKIGEDNDQPLSSYDFVYLPIDFNNKCNVGYGFVNMTSPEATLRLYKAFHHQQWQVFNSRKICEVTYARVQGLEALEEHFKNSKFPHEMEQYCLPVVFSPPRDGRQLTEPLAIVGTHHHHHHLKHHQLTCRTMMISTTSPIGDDLRCSLRSSQNGGVEADNDDSKATTGTSCCSSRSDELSGSSE